MALKGKHGMVFGMKLEEIQRSALELPDADRAALAAELIGSLSSTLVDADDGIAEASKRSKYLDADASEGCSWQELKQGPGRQGAAGHP
jgi:hypothetical protein